MKTLDDKIKEYNLAILELRIKRDELNIQKQKEILKFREERMKEILKLRDNKETFDEIGKKIGISRQRVHQIINL